MKECSLRSIWLWLRGGLLLVMTSLLAGCITGHIRSGEGSAPIDRLVLLTAPAAVDIQPPPGPDGIAVRIYATSEKKVKAIALTRGKLEVLMFDGVITQETPSNKQPLHTWSYTASELKPFASQTAVGVSYALTLLWGDTRPRQENITIVARYITPSGQTIYSGPSTIPVGATP